MWRRSLFLLALCIVSPVLAGAGRGVIAPEVTVKGETLRLKELATFHDVSPVDEAMLEAVVLGNSPRPGQALTLPASTLLTRIRSACRSCDSVAWEIPPRVVIHRSAAQVERSTIEVAVKTYVSERLVGMADTLEIKALRVATPIMVPEGNVVLRLESPRKPLGTSTLTLLIEVDGAVVERIPVTVEVVASVRTLVASRVINKGEELRAQDVQEELRVLQDGMGIPIRSSSDLVGRVAARPLSPGRIIFQEDTVAPPAVKRGEPVTIVLRTERMMITCPGEAKEDGQLGQMISVRSATTDKVLRGTLRNDGIVVVEYVNASSVAASGSLR